MGGAFAPTLPPLNPPLTVDAIFNELKKQLSTFLLHTFVKRKQAASFDFLKKSCDGKSIVLQVNFSENGTIATQKEVQAPHWHHAQAMIFTTHTWINNATNFSRVVISDDLNHTKYSIFIFMQCIFQSLWAKFPSIKTVNVFSDGPTSQFKQRFLFSNLHYWEQDHDISIRWNFFATSHEKSVVDGIGGTVKGQFGDTFGRREVISPLRKSIQHSPNNFAQTFKLNSLPRVRLINNLHFWMPDGKGWWQSPKHTEFTVFKLLVWMRSK